MFASSLTCTVWRGWHLTRSEMWKTGKQKGKKRHKQFYIACTYTGRVQLLKAWWLNQIFIEEQYFKKKTDRQKKTSYCILFLRQRLESMFKILNHTKDTSVKQKQFGLTLLVEQYYAWEAQGLFSFQVKIISATGVSSVAPVTWSTNTCLQTTTIRKWKCLSV